LEEKIYVAILLHIIERFFDGINIPAWKYKNESMSFKEKIFIIFFFILLGFFIAASAAISFLVIIGNTPPRLLGLIVFTTLIGMPVVLILDAALPDKRRSLKK
jgi:hypothetical protein